MRHSMFLRCFCLLLLISVYHKTFATVYTVSSLNEFNSAHNTASAHDSILWTSGSFSNIYMNITKDDLYVGASILGETIFNGGSRVRIDADHITLEGFQFLNGDIGTQHLLDTYGNYTHFNHLNIRDYTCYKYLRVQEECRYVRITYCNFQNRLNLDDQNILSILVDNNNPGYHKIQYCSFKKFDGTGNDMGIEPIRIGLSTQANRISRTLVEYCYFTECDGDGELVSSKATENVYRYNTFENNPKAEFVLRHGSKGIVYGNFFINGKGGVRIREGQNHYIYNNYFYDLDDRAIYIQNEDSDPLSNIHIAFNTIVNCDAIRLGGTGDDPPNNVNFSNNIFFDPKDDIFTDPTGNETWKGNIFFGSLGMNTPSNGLTQLNPQLILNDYDYYELSEDSPAVDAAISGYEDIPQFAGMDLMDADLLLDIMQQDRPVSTTSKDVGCSEYPHEVAVRPHVTEDNTGPIYLQNPTSIEPVQIFVEDLAKLFPNPVGDQLNIELKLGNTKLNTLEIYDIQGRQVDTVLIEVGMKGNMVVNRPISHLKKGVYFLKIAAFDSVNNMEKVQILKFIKG